MKTPLFLLGVALSLGLDASAPSAHAVEAKVNAHSIASAKQATARALLDSMPSAPNFYDVQALAELGDFADARATAKRLHPSEEKVRALQFVAGCAARAALGNRQFSQAELEIRAVGKGSAALWIELSRAYGAAKRPADARRTAFYAATLMRREKDSYGWPDAAWRLCEIGERAAARRFILVAKKELLDPDPLMGSSLDQAVETAARCGFDDLVAAWNSPGVISSFSMIGIYARRNRDDLAQRVIEQTMMSLRKSGSLSEASRESSGAVVANAPRRTAAQIDVNFEFFLRLLMSEAQLRRGDVASARATWQQAEKLLGSDENAPQWSFNTLLLVRLYESSAQWNEADASAARLQTRWSRGEAPLLEEPLLKFSDPVSQARLLFQAQLLGLRVVSQPEKFGLNLRREALERVTPRFMRFIEKYPETKGRALFSLAEAQRSVGDPGWRASLQAAQLEAVAAAKTRNQWDELAPVAQEWQKAGEIEVARRLGREMLTLWTRNQTKTTSGAAFSKQNRNRFALLRLLEAGQLFDEATALLIPRRDMELEIWKSEFRELSRNWQSAPPQKMLEIWPAERHKALLGWAQGLAPKEPRRIETPDMTTMLNRGPF